MDDVTSAAQDMQTGCETLDIARFINEAAHLVATGGANAGTFEQVGRLMRRLDPAIVDRARGELTSLHGTAATSTILDEGPDGAVLMLARFPSEAPTPVHNHNSWGVACVVEGRDRYVAWRRLDDGSDPDRADLEVAGEHELGPGDFVWFEAPPQDIHSQQGIAGPAWEFVYFGRNPNLAPRAYFDPASGTVTYASAT
jgi:predicted metal-dependent enzyme (double-stranded beta helix superfamily)